MSEEGRSKLVDELKQHKVPPARWTKTRRPKGEWNSKTECSPHGPHGDVEAPTDGTSASKGMKPGTTKGVEARGPVLDFTDNSESAVLAVLAKQTVKAVTDDCTIEGDAEIRLDLVPVPGVYLYGVFDDSRLVAAMMNAMSDPESIALLDGQDQRIEGARAGSSWNPDGIVKLRWRLMPEPVKVVGDDRTQMTQVAAHVFNLETQLWRRSGNTAGALELARGAWNIRLKLAEDGLRQMQELREKGGYRLTHIVEVDQEGKGFSGEDADKVLHAIRNFLSFAKGGMCDLVCPSGWDDSGEQVWARWSSPGQWQRTRLSWLDSRDAGPLAEVFPGFMDRWTMDGWEDALRTAIWWYAQANSGSPAIDQGIITAQIAMERLSFEYCVRERALVSKEGFEKLPAADRYRLLLSSLDIPVAMPSAAKSLAATSKEWNWTDSPQTLTEIRNNLVHAGRRGTKLTGEGYFEAWRLATWLLELTILALCNFNGEYWNRLSSAKESVPWAR